MTSDDIFQQFKADPAERMHYFRDVSTFGGCTSGPVAGLENICIIEEEGLLDNVVRMGDHLMDRLLELKAKHAVIGDVRGKGLFAGAELVADRQSKQPADESYAMKIVGHCLSQGVMIGRTNRSFRDLNNTLCLSPALIAKRRDIDDIVEAIDTALTANPLPA